MRASSAEESSAVPADEQAMAADRDAPVRPAADQQGAVPPRGAGAGRPGLVTEPVESAPYEHRNRDQIAGQLEVP